MGKHHLKCLACGVKKDDNPDLKLFKIPINQNRRRTWLQLINRLDLESLKISLDFRFCEIHFSPEMFGQTRHRLKGCAVPCKFLTAPDHDPVTITKQLPPNQRTGNIIVNEARTEIIDLVTPSTRNNNEVKGNQNHEIIGKSYQEFEHLQNDHEITIDVKTELIEWIPPPLPPEDQLGHLDQELPLTLHSDESEIKIEPTEWVQPPIQNDDQARRYLKPLEEYVLMKENYRAIGLISQLERLLSLENQE